MMKCLFTLARRGAGFPSFGSTAFSICRSFSAARCLARSSPKKWSEWSADEDAKLRELSLKELPDARIAQELPGRTITALRQRRHMISVEGPLERPANHNKPWEEWEHAHILQKRREGLSIEEIANFFPGGRTPKAVKSRWRAYKHRFDQGSTSTVHNRPFTHADIQGLVTLRMDEAKSFREIAIETNRSTPSVISAWTRRAKFLVPPELLAARRSNGAWTQEEDDRLIKCRGEGLKISQIALLIPGRSVHAIRSRCEGNLQKQLKWRPRPTLADRAAIEQALEPVIEGTVTIGHVMKQLPQYKPKTIYNIKSRMLLKQSKTHLGDDRKEEVPVI